MNTSLKLTALMSVTLLLSACNLGSSTVYCDDKPVGSKFTYNDMTYLVVDDVSIRYMNNKFMLERGLWRFCTSHVMDMSEMFEYSLDFNEPISDWDVSNVRDMKLMFHNATSFNQPLNHWNTSKVRYMDDMFEGAKAFN